MNARKLGVALGGIALIATPAAIGAAATAASAASAATAGPTAKVAKGCFLNTEKGNAAIVVTSSGWPAGQTIQMSDSKDKIYASGTVAANGTVKLKDSGGVYLTADGAGTASYKVKLTDALPASDGGSSASATVTVHVANLAADTTPAQAKPSKKVKWHFSGFLKGKHIYVHYLHNGKPVRTREFPRASGACGVATGKAKLFPGKPKYKSYKVQIDNGRKYRKSAKRKFVSKLQFEVF